MIPWRADMQLRPEQPVEEMLEDTIGNDRHHDESHDENQQDDRLIEMVGIHQLTRRLDQGVLETHRPQERSHENQCKGCRNGCVPGTWHIFHYKRTEEEANECDSDDDGDVNHDVLELAADETRHVDLLAALHLDARILVFQAVEPTLGEMLRHPIVARHGCLDGVWDDGHRNDDGIQEIVDNAEIHAQSSDDKRKLANLAETEAALHGLFQPQACNEPANNIAQRLENEQHKRDDQNLPPIVDQNLRVDHHADRDEKHRAKQVLDGCRDFMYHLSLKRFGQDAAHDERAEGRREAR